VTALEAVQGATADGGGYAHAKPEEWPKEDLPKGVALASVVFTRSITEKIASALRIEDPAAAKSQTARRS
jgi:hypothetical protein